MSPGGSSAARTILLVEDQTAIRVLIRKALEQTGFVLIDAANGQEALELAESYEGHIDVLVSDILMPKMDGVTLSRLLAESQPNMKVLFISGHPGHQWEALKGTRLTSEFLPKPFTVQTLLTKIQELLG